MVLAGLLLAPALADEARRADGQSARGKLALDRAGDLRFTTTNRRTLAWADLTGVRLSAGDPPPFRVAGGHRLHLRGGQRLTGLFRGLEKGQLVLRTAWAERVAVPRSATVALTYLPGWRPVLLDELAGKLSGWTARGGVTGGPDGLVLKAAGEAVEYRLKAPLPAGRVSVNFRERVPAGGARWLLELGFGAGKSARTVRVTVAWPGKHLEVDTAGLTGTRELVARAAGWRRLVVEFGPGSLRASVDEAALWASFTAGPGGGLRRVALRCVEAGRPAVITGEVAWSAFALERAVDEARRPPGDARQDEVWLAEGDQVFGRVTAADARGIQLEGRFGRRRFGWEALRGWYPRRDKLPAGAMKGTVVRVRLRSGLAADADELEGVITGLDENKLTLKHGWLGELSIARRWVREVRRVDRP